MAFKYPSVKDLQAETGVKLTSNPSSKTTNPPEWEVRSSVGLEATCATYAEAKKIGDDLIAQGVKGVKVAPRPPPAFHDRQGPPPGVPTKKNPSVGIRENPCGARRNPPEIEKGMARAFFVSAFADRYEEMSREERGAVGLPMSASGLDYNNFAPETQPWAYEAADKLYEKFEELNDKPMATLVSEAEVADRKIPRIAVLPETIGEEAYLDSFGHYLAMQAMGHGVSWFDDHAKFPLKVPRIDPYTYFDGDLGLVRSKKPRKKR